MDDLLTGLFFFLYLFILIVQSICELNRGMPYSYFDSWDCVTALKNKLKMFYSFH